MRDYEKREEERRKGDKDTDCMRQPNLYLIKGNKNTYI